MSELSGNASETGVPRRILVIDDSSHDRVLIRRALERAYPEVEITEVASAQDFEEAVDEQFDALISDYHLGWSDGLTLVERIRERSPYIGAVIFTGTGTEEVAVRAMKGGIDDYVVKDAQHYNRLPLAVGRAIERQDQRLALSSAEAEMRDLLDRLPAGIYRSAMEGGLLYGNSALLDILGFSSRSEFLGADLAELYVVPEERDVWIEKLEEKAVVTEEFRIHRPDGRQIWIRDHARLVRAPSGASQFIEGVIEDVTEHRAAERAIERQARRLELLQAVTSIANETTDFPEALEAALEAICATTNCALAHAFLRSPDDGDLEPTGIWITPGQGDHGPYERDTRERTSRIVEEGLVGRVYRSGVPEWVEDVTRDPSFVRSAAAERSGLGSVVAVPVIAGSEVVAIIEVLHPEPRPRDAELLETLRQAGVQLGRVAERQRAARERASVERKVRQSQKMEAVGRLAGGIAHDFNNLLTVLLMETRTAQEEEGVPEPVQEALQSIVDTSERAALLTRQLLSFSRGREHEPEAVDVDEVAEDMSPMLRRIIGERHELRTIVATGPLSVHIDRAELDQVLMNLVINARDAMPDGGTITVEVQRRPLELLTTEDVDSGHCVALSVNDEGGGVPLDIQDSIFEPFVSTKGDSGTGLGLAICYGIVSTSGGDIRVYSEEGVGSTFTVMLPALEADSPRSTEARDHAVPTGTETILVVEDEETVRRVTVRALEAQGYQTIQARDAEEALRLLDQSPDGRIIDLVLSDLVLPGMGGSELIETLRRRDPDLPALLTSGYSADIVRRRAGPRPDSIAVLQKPFSVAELARQIRTLLDRAGEPEARDSSV